ncbi:hypothetical protein PHYPSEUDO_013030 [Phytophthora pseudosyringae]|uniref:Elicitin n=1 Tax=Phytophthora pseudosyringae TaxID=221518 RepID=A0A8T1V5S3_9STRA|nr:hypothetical protein PHYPSEUDO_013030 [Phytophthora pseudosyringae]
MPSRALFAIVGFAQLCSTALAASDTCTAFQIHSTIQHFDSVLSNDECADYATDSSSLSVPCDASSCVAVVDDLVSKLPDCTLSGRDNGGDSANKKTELQNGLDECRANSSASLNVEAVDTSTNHATASSSGGDCTLAEASMAADLYLEAAGSSACEQYAMMDESTMTVSISAPCSATDCVSFMETMAEKLPYCYTDGTNLKEDVLQFLASCGGGGGSTSAAGAFPSSSSGEECTYDEVSSLAYLTDSVVSSNECEAYVIATTTEWYIQIPCSATTCLTTLDDAVQQMPDCEFEGVNYKEELGLQQESCVGLVDSNDASGSAASTNSLRTAAPALDGDVNSTDTSSSALASSDVAGFTLVQVVIILLALV